MPRPLLRFLLLPILFCAALVCGAETVDQLKPYDYVNDFAHVLSPQTTHDLNMLCGQIDHQAHAQIAVITIQTTGDDDIDDFTNKLEERWQVGKKGSDRAVLILLAVKDRKYRIEVGYGLEPILNDAKVGDIGRSMVPDLRQSNYDGALTTSTAQVAQVIATDAHVQLDPQWANYGARTETAQPVHLSPGQVIGAIVFVIFVLWLLVHLGGSGLVGFLLGTFLGGGWGGRGGGGWGGGGFGGGGAGGNDGFGGFGGGGSSGGGGASGSW